MKTRSSFSTSPAVILVFVVLILAVMGILSVFVVNTSASPSKAIADPRGSITVSPADQDMGNVSMAKGIKQISYSVQNNGQEEVTLSALETSCMCTTVVFRSTEGKVSPSYGMPGHGINPGNWSYTLKPGASGELLVDFDPNAHGPDATGPISRVISLYSTAGLKQVGFSANVIK